MVRNSFHQIIIAYLLSLIYFPSLICKVLNHAIIFIIRFNILTLSNSVISVVFCMPFRTNHLHPLTTHTQKTGCNVEVSPDVALDNNATYSDNRWHHVTVKRWAASASITIDTYVTG